MGLKYIKKNLYYYESRREGGKVRSAYVGGGDLALLAADLAARDRRRRESRGRWRAALTASGRAIDETFGRVEAVFVASMTAAGYHRPNWGPWRRRRGMAAAIGGPGAGSGRATLTHGEAQALGRRLNDGDDSVRPALKKWLGNEGAWCLDLLGSPQKWAEDAAVKRWAGSTPLIEVAAPVKLDVLRVELAGVDPSPLKRLLADRVVFCWFALNALEYQAANPPKGGRTYRDAEHLDRCLDHANKRFLAATRSLAVVGKLDAAGVRVTLSRTESISLGAPPVPDGGGHDAPQ